MSSLLRITGIILVLLTAGVMTSCQILPVLNRGTEIQDPTSTPDLNSLPPDLVDFQGQQIRQWAIEAEASSEFAVPEWAAVSATGAPDTNRCGDYQTAWASAGSDSEEWLILRYPISVHVTAVNIIQSFNPDQVVKVELLGLFDRGVVIYEQPPEQINQLCPYTLQIAVDKTEDQYDAVRITVDQSVLGLGWNQIDAVELVGESE